MPDTQTDQQRQEESSQLIEKGERGVNEKDPIQEKYSQERSEIQGREGGAEGGMGGMGRDVEPTGGGYGGGTGRDVDEDLEDL